MIMDSEESSPYDVLSGVPQGSVIGVVLSLVCINNIVADFDSKVDLFADDCALYREITSAEDAIVLHKDLNRLY